MQRSHSLISKLKASFFLKRMKKSEASSRQNVDQPCFICAEQSQMHLADSNILICIKRSMNALEKLKILSQLAVSFYLMKKVYVDEGCANVLSNF